MPENNLEHYAASADDTLPDALGGGGDFLESGESPPPGVGEGGGPYGEPDAGDVDGISEASDPALAENAVIPLEGDEFANLSDEDVHAVAFVEDAIAENHAAYVKAWIRILQDDPAEIFRAAADAEKIMGYLAGLELKARQEAGEDARLFLTVPFADKDEAKRLGAQWDPDTLAWFVPEGVDPTPFVRWTGAGGLNGESEKGWTVREKPLPEENRSSEAKSLSEAKNPQPPGGEKDSSAPTSEPPAFLISIGWQEDGADPQSPMAFFFENRSTDAATLKEWLIANGCGIEPDNEIGGDREWGGVVFSERLAAEECPRYSLHLKSMDGHPLNLDAIEAFKAVLRDAMPPRSAPDTARIAAANEEDMEENIMAGARP